MSSLCQLVLIQPLHQFSNPEFAMTLTSSPSCLVSSLIIMYVQHKYTHNVHCSCHREVKRVKGGLVFHNSFISERRGEKYLHPFALVNNILLCKCAFHTKLHYLSMVNLLRSIWPGGAVMRSRAWPSSVWKDVWNKKKVLLASCVSVCLCNQSGPRVPH